MARAERRRRALEALELERNREAALRDQLRELASELEGERVDAGVLARMSGEEVEVVRAAWAEADAVDLDLGEGAGLSWMVEEEDETSPEEERRELLAEIARLEQEIARSQRRQGAFQRYLQALVELEACLEPSQERSPFAP